MNNSGTPHDLQLDREQFEARLEALLESEREWDIELEGLEAHEVMTLFTTFAAGAEHLHNSGAPPEQIRVLGRMQEAVKADVPEIAEAVDDMTDSAERAAEESVTVGADRESPDGGIQRFIPSFARPPFGRVGGPWTPADIAWALGMLLVFVQAFVGFINLGATLGGVGTLPLSTLVSIVTGIGGAALFAFALGYVAADRREVTPA